MDHKEELMRLKAREKRFRDEAEARIADLEAEIARLRANSNPNSLVEDLREKLAALGREKDQLSMLNGELQEKFNKASAQAAARIADLDERNEYLEHELSSLRGATVPKDKFEMLENEKLCIEKFYNYNFLNTDSYFKRLLLINEFNINNFMNFKKSCLDKRRIINIWNEASNIDTIPYKKCMNILKKCKDILLFVVEIYNIYNRDNQLLIGIDHKHDYPDMKRYYNLPLYSRGKNLELIFGYLKNDRSELLAKGLLYK